MAKRIFILVIFILLGAASFFGLRYANIAREKSRLTSELNGIKNEITLLEAQMREGQDAYGALSQEKASLLDILQGMKNKIAQLRSKNALNQRHVFSLIREIKGLQNNKIKLTERIALLETDNSQLSGKLNSIPELKKAIKELRKKMREDTRAMAAGASPDNMLDGNLGYLVKDGASTYGPRIVIEVKPIE